MILRALVKRLHSKERDGLRADFWEVISKLNDGQVQARLAVAHGLNQTNTFFIAQHHDVASFQRLPRSERLAYIQKLSAFEDNVRKIDPTAALGTALFKMWIATIVEEDKELNAEFSAELARLSKLIP